VWALAPLVGGGGVGEFPRCSLGLRSRSRRGERAGGDVGRSWKKMVVGGERGDSRTWSSVFEVSC